MEGGGCRIRSGGCRENVARTYKQSGRDEGGVEEEAGNAGIGCLLEIIVVGEASHLGFGPFDFFVRDLESTRAGAEKRMEFGDLNRGTPVVKAGTDAGGAGFEKGGVAEKEAGKASEKQKSDEE